MNIKYFSSICHLFIRSSFAIPRLLCFTDTIETTIVDCSRLYCVCSASLCASLRTSLCASLRTSMCVYVCLCVSMFVRLYVPTSKVGQLSMPFGDLRVGFFPVFPSLSGWIGSCTPSSRSHLREAESNQILFPVRLYTSLRVSTRLCALYLSYLY